MATDPLIGEKMGDYTIESLLGRGGMARVYQGYDANLDRYAAVKVIDAHLINSDEREEYYERFQREARAIARLQHPNIVGVYQFGEYEAQYYMAMVFIDGQDLRQVLKGHVKAGTLMSPVLVLKIMQAMTSALDYAHAEGVIHRDIKPSNILVTEDGKAILTDFGLALNLSDGTIGNTFGSAHYIAPEQAVSSAHAVAQSDMYSLGICLYEMLTGSVPFDDASAMSVALKHLSDPPPPPSQLNPNIPAAVEQVMMRVLEKEPENRYENCAAFMADLKEAFKVSETVDTTSGISKVRANASIPRPVDMPPPRRPVNSGSDSIPSPLPNADTGSRRSVSRLEQTAQKKLRKSQEVQRVGPQRNLLPWVIGGIIIVLLLGAGLFLGLSVLNGSTATPTAAAIADVNPTDTPTDTPTETASAIAQVGITPLPTDPPPPTITPTDTENLQPTTTALIDNPVEIVLIYEEDTLILHNTSDQPVDVSGLTFYQQRPESTPIRVSISRIWGRGSEPPSRLPAGGCFQVWSRGSFSRLPSPNFCSRQAFYGIEPTNDFWIPKSDVDTFELRLGADTIATCPIEAGECVVAVPASS
jgi:serine/threonine protein kinase